MSNILWTLNIATDYIIPKYEKNCQNDQTVYSTIDDVFLIRTQSYACGI